MGPNAAAVMYGNADAITPSTSRPTIKPPTDRNMPRLRRITRRA
jgi:hypothetical protein